MSYYKLRKKQAHSQSGRNCIPGIAWWVVRRGSLDRFRRGFAFINRSGTFIGTAADTRPSGMLEGEAELVGERMSSFTRLLAED